MIDPNINYADEFVKMVKKSPSKFPNKIKKAVKRYESWKKRDDIWFDVFKANQALDFMESFVRHTKGSLAGQLIHLEPWERFGYAQLYGWQHYNDKGEVVRVIREVYWQVPKKNGKTTIGVGGMAYAMYGEGEKGADVYCCASDFAQAQYAAKPFGAAVSNSEELYENSQIFKGKKGSVEGIVYRYVEDGLSYENNFYVMSKDAKKIEGSNPYFVLNDELHAQTNMDQYDNFKSAMSSREQPIMFNISTAGKGSTSVGMRVYHESNDILDKDNDDSRLVLIYEPNKNYKWDDRKVWAMVNPNLGVSLDMSTLEIEFKSAQRSAHGKAEFLSKHLDVFVNSADNYFDRDQVEPILRPDLMPEDLEDREVVIGLDLSKTTDLTCVSLNFPIVDDDGKAKLYVKQRYYIPFENVEFREKEDNVPYRDLAEQGFVEFCDGKMIDQDQILEFLRECIEKYNVLRINYDPAMSQKLVEQCENLGIECIAIMQYPNVMNEVVDDTERLIYDGRLYTDNPLLVYCLLNMTVVTNVNGMKAPSKHKSTKKIDGAAAFMDAHKTTITLLDDVDPENLGSYLDDIYR